MRRDYRYYLRITLLVLTLLFNVGAEAKFASRYNEQRPLIVVCDWDMPPYEFLDDKGQPAGYSVDLMNIILDRLEIPHVFQMREGFLAKRVFQQHRADVIIAPDNMLRAFGSKVSTSVLSYFRPKVVMKTDAPEIHSLTEIDSSKVVVLRKGDDYIQKMFLDAGLPLTPQYLAPMEALVGVATDKYDFFIWGEDPMKWRIQKLHLDSLRICDVELPIAEVHIGAYDQALIDAMDDQYARLEQHGVIDDLRNKWLHPDRRQNHVSPIVLYVVVAAVLLLLVLFFLNRLIVNRVEKKVLRNSEQTRLMGMALDMGGYMVAEYQPQRDEFKNLRGHLMDEDKTMEQSIATVHPEDLSVFQTNVDDLAKNNANHIDMQLRRNLGTADHPDWQYLTGCCIKERDEEEQRTSYLLVAKDVTAEINAQEADHVMAAKYNKAFQIALLAMSFYSPEGRLLEMNDKMKELIGLDEANQQFFWDTSLFEAPLFRDVLTPGMTDVVHACQHMYYPDINLNKYLEYRIRPVFTEEGEIRYYVVTVRDISSERSLYLEQQATERQLKVTNDEVKRFETQMNDLLSNSGMYIWRTNNKTRMVSVGRSLHKVDTQFSYEDYLNGMAHEGRDEANMNFYNPLMYNQNINAVRYFKHSPLTHREGWFATSGMPYYDRHGNVQGHFGIVREVTKLMRSQEELRRETTQAKHSGQLKAAFLANMTHEIRTPLNAIVGFSDLLHTVDTQEERQEFIRIIRHNCDLLLRLIDDILETSYLEGRPQSIEPENIDFSQFFNEVCQTVAQRVQEPGVSFIGDNPYDTFPACVDKERVQQVITNFVTNAVKYTHEGHIKVGYREERRVESGEHGEERDGIYIYCEDTGAGIPQDKQASVFDRFVKLNDYVQGTGLGLSICKSIADRCRGHIGVTSEGEGKGSTFWLWIPRHLTFGNLTA